MVPGQLLDPHCSHLLSKQEDVVSGEGTIFPEGSLDFYIFHCPFLIRKETRKYAQFPGRVHNFSKIC